MAERGGAERHAQEEAVRDEAKEEKGDEGEAAVPFGGAEAIRVIHPGEAVSRSITAPVAPVLAAVD